MIKLPTVLQRANERLPEGTWLYVLPFAVLVVAVAYVFVFETVDPNEPATAPSSVNVPASSGRPGS